MVEVVKSYETGFALLTILKLQLYVCGEKIGSIADIGRKILNMLILVRKIILNSLENFFDLPPPVDNISGKIFYDLVKILRKVCQNMTTPPQLLMASRRPCMCKHVGVSIRF
jgi:hypothetical protein